MARDNDQGSAWASVVAAIATLVAMSALYAPLLLR